MQKKAALENLPSKRDKLMDELYKTAMVESRKQSYVPALLDIADMDLPEKMKDVFKWCRYFYKFDALINASCNKLAIFPVTNIIFVDRPDGKLDEDSRELAFYKRVLMDKLNLPQLLLLFGIDYYVYGNVFMFGEFESVSKDPYDVEWKTVYRLDPNEVEIEVNPHTKERVYKLHISPRLRKIITSRQPKEIYNTIPEKIKKAAQESKMIVLNSKNIYHAARPSESGDGSVWGSPVILAALKLLMYRNTLRQAQLAIAKEHMVPTKIVYLNYGAFEPEFLEGLNKTAMELAKDLEKAAVDPNHKVVSPIPVGTTYLGGQGRSLLLVQELQASQEEILACMNLPREFIFGGVSYSSSSISLRVLENDFKVDRAARERFINEFLIKRMAQERREWTNERDNSQLIKAKFAPLKMQDDVQQKSLMVQLAGAGKVDDETLYDTLELDAKKIKERIDKDAKEKIRLKNELILAEMDAQFEQQKKQFENNIKLQLFQQTYLQQLAKEMGVPIETLTAILQGGASEQNLEDNQTQNQEESTAQEESAVQEEENKRQEEDKLQEESTAQEESAAQEEENKRQEEDKEEDKLQEVDNGSKVDDRPLPEKRPPRRNSLK